MKVLSYKATTSLLLLISYCSAIHTPKQKRERVRSNPNSSYNVDLERIPVESNYNTIEPKVDHGGMHVWSEKAFVVTDTPEKLKAKELANTPTPAGVNEETLKYQCPLSKYYKVPKPGPTLFRCPEYADSTCCSPEEHKRLDDDFRSLYNYIYSECPGCLENFRRLQCAIFCAPNQHEFVKILETSPNTNINKTPVEREIFVTKSLVRICPALCNRLYFVCASTSAQALFEDSQSSFCTSQMDRNENVSVELNAYDCLNIEGPDHCTGDPAYLKQSMETGKISSGDQLTLLLFFLLLFTMGLMTVICCHQLKKLRQSRKPDQDQSNLYSLKKSYFVKGSE